MGEGEAQGVIVTIERQNRYRPEEHSQSLHPSRWANHQEVQMQGQNEFPVAMQIKLIDEQEREDRKFRSNI